MCITGSVRSYFRGNGANVIKIAPETAIKLTLNDQLKAYLMSDPKHPSPLERMAVGGIAGAVAQVG
jgi:solute carrier family 25 phosphate transporter 23/24/25/41